MNLNNSMTVSIITSSFNNSATIKDTIESVLSQTHSPVEYIIIDGASNDGTLDIIKSYGNRITRYISEPDHGIYDALNKGLQLATGEIIGFLHADDMYADNSVIAKVVAVIGESARISGAYGDLQFVSKDDPSRVIRYWKSKSYSLSLLRKGWMPPHPTLFIRKEIYERYGYFDTSYRIAADYELILRFFSQPEFNAIYIPDVLIKMRMGGASTGKLRNLMLKSLEDYRSIRKNKAGGILTLIRKNLSKINQFIPTRDEDVSSV